MRNRLFYASKYYSFINTLEYIAIVTNFGVMDIW